MVWGTDSGIEHFGVDERTSLRHKEVNRTGMWKIKGVVQKLKVLRRQYLKTGSKKSINLELVPATNMG